jgi:hypothetical protein
MKTYGKQTSLGCLVALVVIFASMKITEIIFWSWIWVFSPLWIPVAGIVCFLVGLMLAMTILHLIELIYENF